jgi:hypothetical protein
LGFDPVLVGCGTAAEVALLLLMLGVRAYRTQPAFFIYIAWSVLIDGLMYLVRFHSAPATFYKAYEIQLLTDSVMIFAVVVELAWNVLRPIRSSLPKYTWLVLVILIALAGLAIWPIAGFTHPDKLDLGGIQLFRLQQTMAILRVVVFLVLAGCSHLLSIGWRNRELQIATGLGFFSLISLAVGIMHTHQLVEAPQYHLLDQVVAASYIAALGYWVYCFATKEAERRSFTPQMESFLLAAAGTARSTRITMTDTRSRSDRDREE